MTICTCEKCRYTFQFPLLPLRCPDCGKEMVRLSTDKEIKEYWRMQEILKEEISLGVIPAL